MVWRNGWGGGGGGGSTAFSGLTDAATANLPAVNTPLSTALNLKLDKSSVINNLTAGGTTSALSAQQGVALTAADVASGAVSGNNLNLTLKGGSTVAIDVTPLAANVVEVATFNDLPATGEAGKRYVTLNNNRIYRWTGSSFLDVTRAGSFAVAANWTTTWDMGDTRDLGTHTITGPLAIVSSNTFAVNGGYTQAVIVADGVNTPTFDGAALAGWDNTAGAKNVVRLIQIGGEANWVFASKLVTQSALAKKQDAIQSVTWSTTWDMAGMKDMGDRAITGPTAITVDTTGSVIGGYTQAVLIANGTNIPTFNGTPLASFVNTNGARNYVQVYRSGGSWFVTAGASLGTVI